ncbi:YjcQ family protein [Hominimerdicola sp. 21CYCFAH17_S]
MNDNFTCIYKILRALEKAMDCTEFDLSQIDHTTLEVSKERWAKYIEMMCDVGYIKGVRIYENVYDEICVEDNGIRITLKGLEYLSENTIMQRMYKTAKGVKDLIPLP